MGTDVSGYPVDMDMTPKDPVTIIVSTYNWPGALSLCLRSIMGQSVLPQEVIVADDGSGDDTSSLIKDFQQRFPCPLVHIWHEDTGFRLAAIRNKAIASAKGDYIIQIDGDIILHKHFVKDHIAILRKDCFVSGSRVLLGTEISERLLSGEHIKLGFATRGIANRFNCMRIPALRDYYRFRYKAAEPYYVKGCNMAFWRDDLIAVNGYNEDMTGWGHEDIEIAARLINAGRRRQFLKAGGIEFHIYHPVNDRGREPVNYGMFEKAVADKLTYCANGIDKYLART